MKKIMLMLILSSISLCAQAELTMRNMDDNSDLPVKSIQSFSTFENFNMSLELKNGDLVSYEITERSLSEVAISKKELLDLIDKAIADENRRYIFAYKTSKLNVKRQILVNIFF